MLHPKVKTTMEEIDAAIARAQLEPEGPTVLSVEYHAEPSLDLFILKISDGRRIVLPREDLQALQGSTPEQAADFVIGPFGTDVWWPQLDEGIYLPNLLEGRYEMRLGWNAFIAAQR